MINSYSRLGRSGGAEVGESAEIHSLEESAPISKTRPSLLPGEEAASLPASDYPLDPAQGLLTTLVGRRLSVDNPAWSGDPIPRMRALQKKLIEFSLSQEESQRRSCMEAIRVVELAVTWRLRWQQMRRSELESGMTDEPVTQQEQESEHEEKESA